MSELVDIEFEQVPKKKYLFEIVNNLSNRGEKITYLTAESKTYTATNWNSTKFLEDLIVDDKNYPIIGIINEIHLNDLVIPEWQFRLIYYDNCYYDLCLNFDLCDVPYPSDNLLSSLMLFCKELTLSYSIKNYYAGLDPACDDDTRFFTSESVGPLDLQSILEETKAIG